VVLQFEVAVDALDFERAEARDAASCNKQLRRRSPVIASAANLEQNFAFRLKRPFGPAAGEIALLFERQPPALRPEGFGESRSAICTSFAQKRSGPAALSAG
jgi:hypothetical protein